MPSIILDGRVIVLKEGPTTTGSVHGWEVHVELQPFGGIGESVIIPLRVTLEQAQDIEADQEVTITITTIDP